MTLNSKYSPVRTTVYHKHTKWLLHKARDVDPMKNEISLSGDLDKILRDFMRRLGWTGSSSNNVYWKGTKVPIKVIVVPRPYDNSLITLINPRYKELKGKQFVDTETCGSIPSRSFQVPRFPIVIVKCNLINGNYSILEYNSLLSITNVRVLQHEMDHLEGVLISQREKEREDSIDT